MKNTDNFTQWKNGSVDVTITCAITHQKHLMQSRHSTRSAVDIFNTLHLFTKQPIREQEIKLGVYEYQLNARYIVEVEVFVDICQCNQSMEGYSHIKTYRDMLFQWVAFKEIPKHGSHFLQKYP